MNADSTKRRRARHVASDEAHAWARSLPLNNPNAKTVLRALALYVNGEGSCFVGIDQLSEDTDLSADTVRRRLVWLEQIGAIVRLHQWLDANGRRNSEGRGKRTTDEIRLLLDADAEEIERAAKGDGQSENIDNSSTETTSISPSSVLGQPHAGETVSPTPALGQPSQSCDHLTSEPEPESPPKPPSGGSVDIEGWKEFQEDWQEPILRQSLAQQVWVALTADERSLARRAARGYVAHRKAQRKPPNAIGAHLFLKERDAWPAYAERAPGEIGYSGGIPSDSVEASAIRGLFAVANAAAPFEHKNRIVFQGKITPQLLAFADVGERAAWRWLEAGKHIAAWSEFLNANVQAARRPFVVTRTVDGQERRGIWVPWNYPPSVDGKIYDWPPLPQNLTDTAAGEAAAPALVHPNPTRATTSELSDAELADFK